MTIYFVLAGLSIFIVVGIIILPVVLLVGAVLTIIGGIKANDGIAYRYPFTIRLLD